MRLICAILLSFAIALSVAGPGTSAVVAESRASSPAPGSASMQVSLKLAQVPISTALGSLAMVATVTSGGQPVPSAVVAFNDAHNSAFNNTGSTAETNASGIAVAAISIVSPFPGPDTLIAVATAPGHDTARATVPIKVLCYGIQQLAVTASVVNDNASGGSSEVIQGRVGTVVSASSEIVANVGAIWNPTIYGVSGALVTISDTLGSTFSTLTVVTNNVGFYSVNFTLGKPANGVADIFTLSATRDTFNGSESSFVLAVNPYGPKSLTVTLDSFYPSKYSTVLGSATIEARVTAGGTPVEGVPVTFSDALGSLYSGQSGTTDASGIAITTVDFYSQGTGLDMLTARATNGSNFGVGSNTFKVLPLGAAQLSVLTTVASNHPIEGTTERVIGKVGWVSTGTSYAWSPSQNGVSGVSVVISDSLGSFAPFTVLTDAGGKYSGAFAVPSATGEPDVIVATASSSGYKGSASSVFIVAASNPTPVGKNASSPPSETSTSATTSAPSQSSAPFQASSTVVSTGSKATSVAVVAPLAVLALAVVALLLYSVKNGKRKGPSA